jgi:hypothetical protein
MARIQLVKEWKETTLAHQMVAEQKEQSEQ